MSEYEMLVNIKLPSKRAYGVAWAVAKLKGYDMSEYEMLVNIKLPSKRAYGVAWAVAKLKGYDTLDQWINDLVVDALEMYPDGRAGLDTDEVDWGFETRQQIEKERLALK